MSSYFGPGEPYYGEIVSSNASGGVTFTLYKGGSATAFTLAANESVSITDYYFQTTDGGTFAIYGTSDAAGQRLVKGELAAKGGVSKTLGVPHSFAAGVTPKLTAASGNVVAIIHGYISSAGA